MENEKEAKNYNEKIKEYILNMDDKEKKAFEIAKEHLGSSFDIEKAIGFNKFLNK